MVIGLTGKYCAGKNAAASILERQGYPSIDVDKLGHQALSANCGRIEEAFGSSVIRETKAGRETLREVDRRALGEIVFSDPDELAKLESISHPWMKEETARLVKQHQDAGAHHVVVNAAILYKMKLDSLCDAVLWVDAPLITRIKRGLNRDKAGLRSVLQRIYAQKQLKPKPSSNSVDIYKVSNGSNSDELKQRLDSVIANIEQKGRDGR